MSDGARGRGIRAEGARGRARARNRINLVPAEAGQQDDASSSVSAPSSSAASVVGSEVSTGTRSIGSSMEALGLGGSSFTGGRDVDTVSIAGSSGSGGDSGRGLRTTIKPGFLKTGKGGETFYVLTNYLNMNKTPNFQLHQYRVDFKPEEDSTELKKMLLRSQEGIIGSYVFDGHMLYVTRPIPLEKRTLVVSNRPKNSSEETISFEIFIRPVGYVLPSSPMYLQFYNMVMRRCLSLIGMEELGRHFYNRHQAKHFNEARLELWPGIITAIRNHEIGTFLCVEVTHKVLRKSSVLEVIEMIRSNTPNQQEYMKQVKKELVGTIVMTHYNRRTYKIDDIAFDVTPDKTFRQQDGVVTRYADYYKQRYKVDNLDLTQPMLVSIPKKKDLNKGITGNIYLIPALCNPTGLTDNMRKNFGLMKDLSDSLHMGPSQRKHHLDEFVRKIKETVDVKKEFEKWDIDFIPDFVMATARKYPSEKVYMGPEGSDGMPGDNKADWTRNLKGRGMLFPKELNNWIIFAPSRDGRYLDNLVDQLRYAARAINVNIGNPMQRVFYEPPRIISTIRDKLNQFGDEVKFVFVILQNNNVNVYADVKKLCVLDFGLGCQCFLAKHMNRDDPKTKQKLGSICTKVMIQITAKLGGVPWGVKIPVKRLMILGFDVYHCTERKNESVGALVSTTDQALNQYFSSVNFHKDKSELGKNLTGGMRKALEAFRINNAEALPDRVILFRDGVGEGQINYVLDIEIPELQAAIQEVYRNADQTMARLSVVIVTKKINSRVILARSGNPPTYDNVPPGTVVDNTITLPERYDYFLVAQSVNKGTVSPTNYNVIFDESDFTAEQMQKLSFKLCHLYYNWCGTVAVPAPCQYAHKLAYLTGIALNAEAPLELSKALWYL